MTTALAPASAWPYGISERDSYDPNTDDHRRVGALIDFARQAMEGEIGQLQARCREYLRWYSPPWNSKLRTHDAWGTEIRVEDVDLTRSNFPIARAVVDIWTALEASAPIQITAEPRRVSPPPQTLDETEAQRFRLVYQEMRSGEANRATARSEGLRKWHRRDAFNYKNYIATRKKNLYGFSWVKIIPNWRGERPMAHVVKDPTTVFPIWSDLEPGDVEAVLCAYQKNAMWANAKWGLGLSFKNGHVDIGQDNGEYRGVADQQYDTTRTMVYVEEYWWIEREFSGSHAEQSGTTVRMVQRVAGRIVADRTFPWRNLPFVYFENTDERDSYGWSDIAGIIDINDEFNRRMSQEGDIIGTAAAPRYQLLNGLMGRSVDMPQPFELIALQDQERIEQILTRIDLFPTQQHFNVLTDLLHRVSGLPPIVWGLIANAQTSGRALTASWKATEARLSPKLMRNEVSHRRWIETEIDYAHEYDWRRGKLLYTEDTGQFDDWRINYPPMEPRDFQEVTMNAITKRDAGLTTTPRAMAETGEEAPEDMLEGVLAENMNIAMHPDKVNAYLLALRAELDNQAYAQQLQQQQQQPLPANAVETAASVRGAVAAQPPTGPGPFPPTQPGAPGNAGQAAPGIPPGPGGQIQSGTLVRGGNVSGQLLQRGEIG